MDRIPKQRYYDPEFYALETELFWPRVWQMACRLEEIPKPGDFVEYEILDQSVIVVRVDDSTVRAYYNSCRHRGMKLVEGSGSRRNFVCPFHGWCWGLDGKNTFVLRSEDVRRKPILCADDLALASVRCELWGGCAWINLDDNAPPLRDCIEPFASRHDEWKVGALRTEWWKSCLLPVNWKLATAAFMEGYHVPQTHPQLLPSSHNPESSVGAPAHRDQPVLHADARLRHGRHDPRERYADRRRAAAHVAAERSAPRRWRPGGARSTMPSPRGTGREAATFPTSTTWSVAGVSIPSASASRTTSSSRSTAARRRTGSARSGPEQTLFEVWSLTRYPNDQSPGKTDRARAAGA